MTLDLQGVFHFLVIFGHFWRLLLGGHFGRPANFQGEIWGPCSLGRGSAKIRDSKNEKRIRWIRDMAGFWSFLVIFGLIFGPKIRAKFWPKNGQKWPKVENGGLFSARSKMAILKFSKLLEVRLFSILGAANLQLIRSSRPKTAHFCRPSQNWLLS